MTGHLRQPIWIVPLAIAGLVAIFGWWGNTRLRQTIEEELKEDGSTGEPTALSLASASWKVLVPVWAVEPSNAVG